MAHRNMCLSNIFMTLFIIVSSPVWLPLGAIYLGIFVPIQKLSNSFKLKQFQRLRRKQLFSTQNIQLNNEPQVNDELQDQLIFKFKPVHYIDVEMQITQTQIQLISNNIILYSQPVPYDFQSKYFNIFCDDINDSRYFSMYAKYIERELQLPRPQFNQPVVCYGKIFLNIFDFIFTIEDFNLKYYAQMPKYTIGATYNNLYRYMFKINGKLYCHNKSDKFYEIKPSGRLKCVSQSSLKLGNKIKLNNEEEIDSTNNMYDTDFPFDFKLKSCQLFLNHKTELKMTSLVQTQNTIRSQFQIVKKIILTIANQHRTIASSIQKAFQEINQ
ncbi:Hypothetical_protein [Hexamita inflata]|uniref:Hypothetical_protein n=1 Tax=Hexamita inflata TaxID=28002 RepID=A0AA86RGE6_9EUKA|nr:Hypothetical protein HINF_LOCUS7489 [Hexamita inflata]CAI9977506.1 Hypothetical protein HINF_LOCUS65151 [Hexamita inflata]